MIALKEQMMLEGYGYQVVVAATGEQALEICGSDPEIDLVLMDIDLGAGRLSGPATAVQLLKNHRVPVLFLSSHAKPEIVAQTEKISTYGYVVKSSEGTMLDASIKMALRLFQANVRLEEEKMHLQTTLESVGDAVIATDAAGRITRINPVAQNLTGWTLDDALGKPVQDVANITNVQAGPSASHPVHAALGTGGAVVCNRSSSLRAKNGTVRPIESFAAPIKDSLGNIMGAVFVFRDIAEESRLRDERRHLDYVIEESQRVASIGSFRGDFTRNFWEISVEMKRIFGLGDSTPVNLTTWLALVHPEDQGMVWRHMQDEVIGQQKPFDKEYRILRESDGETRWVRGIGTVTFDPPEIPFTMTGTIQDITELKAMAANLREKQEQLALFMRHSPIHTYVKEVTERESRVLFASESFTDLIGIPGSQLTGKTMEELFPLEFAAKMTRDDWAVVSGKQVLALDEEFNGRHYSTIKFPITQGGNKLLAGYSIEITERKHAEDKIKALLADKERLLEEVHHRIKNALYSINGLLTLQASTESQPDGRATLLEAANRVQSMMMLYEKLQQSSDYLSVSSQAYLSSLAVAVVANFSGNIPVTLEKSIEDCLLSAEKCQPLGLILNELLTNVMRHAFVGKDSGNVVVTFRADQGRRVLVVHDDGLGLPDSIDFRNSPSLGLKLVGVLSRQLGGTVRAERGNGTKVIVEFPSSSAYEEGG
jgi:PAS domain S-box-containing protein